nr:inositol monophosphatase family protein [Brevibacillus marinus]
MLRTIAPALDWCLLANGWIDYIILQRSSVLDVAAGILIAQEAGATITDWQGRPYRHQPFAPDHFPSLMASNGLLHEEVRRLIRE